MIAIADTHAIIWYLTNDSRLGTRARQLFDDAYTNDRKIGFSTITLVEMVYLVEKGRIPAHYFASLTALLKTDTSILQEVPLTSQITYAMQQIDRKQVPDMPDRIIGATGLQLGLPVISRDGKIRASSIITIW